MPDAACARMSMERSMLGSRHFECASWSAHLLRARWESVDLVTQRFAMHLGDLVGSHFQEQVNALGLNTERVMATFLRTDPAGAVSHLLRISAQRPPKTLWGKSAGWHSWRGSANGGNVPQASRAPSPPPAHKQCCADVPARHALGNRRRRTHGERRAGSG